MHILISTIGSGGDIHPFIAVARELARRGHHAEMLVNPIYEARIRAAVRDGEGVPIRVRPAGAAELYREVERDPRIAHPRRSTRFILDQLMRQAVPTTVEACENAVRERKPDVLFRHHVSIGSRWVARRHGIPVVTGVLAPLFFFSRLEPALFKGWPFENAPPWVRHLRYRLGRATMRHVFDRPLRRQRRELGYPDERDCFYREITDAEAMIGMWSPAFRPPLADDPAGSRIAGFCFFDDLPSDDPHATSIADPTRELDRFLDSCDRSNDPPIVFSLGTVISHHGRRFYAAAAEAARLLDRRAVLLGPRADQLPPSLPAGVIAAPYAPYSRIIPRASALVHHGGIGTTAQCLRAGKPMVVVPHIADQFDHAARGKRLGVSETVHESRVTPERLASALRLVLNEASCARAASMAGAIAREDGPSLVADAIERAAKATPRVT
jgi:UDP:flavonoid glycosyltransferase YjiC (YdhE family)